MPILDGYHCWLIIVPKGMGRERRLASAIVMIHIDGRYIPLRYPDSILMHVEYKYKS